MILNSLNSNTADTQLQTIESELGERGDVFSSLINSQKQWQDIPEIVHLTFKSVGEFMEMLDRKTSHLGTSLYNAFSKMIKDKVSREDLEAKFLQTLPKETEKSRSIEFKLRKQEILDLETVQQIKNIAYAAVENRLQQFHYTPSQSPSKQEMNSIYELTELFNKQLSKLKDSVKVCETKLLNQAVSSPEKRLNQQISNVKSQLFQLQRNIEKKLTDRMQIPSNRSFQKSFTDPRIQYMQSQMQTLRKMMQQLLRSKLDKKQYIQFKTKTNKQLLDKIKLQEVQEIIKSIQSQLQNKIQQTKGQMRKLEKALIKQYKQDGDQLRKTIQKIGQNKQSTPSINNNSSLKQIKLSLGRMEKKMTDKMLESKDQKSDIKQDLQDELKKFWKKIQTELQLRDQKLCQTIQESRDTIRTQYKTVRSKSKQSTNKDHQKLLNSICNQLVLGKWLSTKLNTSQCCIWEQQMVNTMSQNFKWQENSSSILLVAEGVYRVQFGFFSPSGSFPSIIINGQVAVKYLDNKSKQIKKHVNGYLNGSTIIQLILVPPRCKLSIQMSKPQSGQSYIGIYKV